MKWMYVCVKGIGLRNLLCPVTFSECIYLNIGCLHNEIVAWLW